MGLFDFFRRNKNKAQNMDNMQQNQSDLTLTYKSGTRCDIKFSELREMQLNNGSNKMVQEVIITYTEPDGTFLRKSVILDPQIVEDKDRNKFYATKEYYKCLAKDKKGLVKGFFQKEQLEAIENGYIGHIGIDPNSGVYNRSYDKDLKAYYNEIWENNKIAYKYNQEQTLEQQLREQTKKIENMEMNVKDSHAEKLDPSMMPEWMKNEDDMSI